MKILEILTHKNQKSNVGDSNPILVNIFINQARAEIDEKPIEDFLTMPIRGCSMSGFDKNPVVKFFVKDWLFYNDGNKIHLYKTQGIKACNLKIISNCSSEFISIKGDKIRNNLKNCSFSLGYENQVWEEKKKECLLLLGRNLDQDVIDYIGCSGIEAIII